MLITETTEIGSREFIHNYSDAKKMIRKIGTEELYEEAYDPIEYAAVRKYEETDQDVPEEPDELSAAAEDINN